MAGVYVPRSPTTGVLYGVVRTHLAAFLADIEARTDGLPAFVVGEFRKFLRCGVLAHGFARVRCGDCVFERLVPFSCMLATIEDPAVIRRIPTHLGLSMEDGEPVPARAPPEVEDSPA